MDRETVRKRERAILYCISCVYVCVCMSVQSFNMRQVLVDASKEEEKEEEEGR